MTVRFRLINIMLIIVLVIFYCDLQCLMNYVAQHNAAFVACYSENMTNGILS